MADERILSRLVVVGASHRTSSEATRDRLFISEDDLPGFLKKISVAGFSEAVAMSTCARTEIFGLADNIGAARLGAIGVLSDLGGLDADSLAGETYSHAGEGALRHLFRVAASLDSPIVGEPEVTGQFRDAVRIATAHDHVGSGLSAIIQAANGAAKRIRSETTIGERSVSMAACASQVARDVQGDLSRVSAILVTGGEMGELIVDQMRAAGLKRLTVIARSRARAEIGARRYECHHGLLDDLPALLPEADIVVTSLGAGRHLFDRAAAERALAQRRRRPMLFVDAAIPSDVDPAVNELDGAFVYSLDDLERIALEGRSSRDRAAEDAESIVGKEVDGFRRATAERNATPAVTALRAHFERVRADVLAESSSADAALDDATRRLVNRLLHAPSEALRMLSAKDDPAGLQAEKLLRQLFDIDSGLPNDRDAGTEEENKS
ncbi:MAG: glutamyl-tRNA reductase [Paracoccaceae bacterium]